MEAKKEQKGFSVVQICRIIKACKKNCVSEFKFGELSLKFGEETLTTRSNLPTRRQMRANEEEDYESYSDSEQEEIAAAQTLIDNPVEYENQQIDSIMNTSRVGNEAKDYRRPQ